MDDLISRQAAIDETWKEPSYTDPYNVLTEVRERIQSLSPAQQWIPCSERVPEDDDYRPCYGHDDGAVWWINDIGQMGLGWYYTSTKTWAYYDEISSRRSSFGV